MSACAPLVSWSKISKSFGRRALFSGVSGELGFGETLVVTGANGAGKSTFLKIVAGLMAADAGEVVRPPLSNIGYASPSLELYGDLTGAENLRFFASIAGIEKFEPDELLALVGLSRANSKLYSSYSSGMKQRLKLAFAVLRSPSVLILDEPTIALDSEGTDIVDELIRRRQAAGGCALIATNNRSEADRWAGARFSIGSQSW